MRRRAVDWGKAGVRINAIVPGQTQTPVYQGAKDDPVMGQFVDSIPVPLGRVASPEEIGAVIAFMLGEATAFMTGSVVWVDGGTDAAIRPDEF